MSGASEERNDEPDDGSSSEDATRLLSTKRLRGSGLWGALRALRASVAPQRARHRLPPEVLASIESNDALSEVLVRLIQFLVFGTFALFYWLAPKPASAFMSYAPNVLGVYLVIIVVLVWLATKRKLPDWFVYTSIAVDMALLAGLIWSFHLQYDQPPAFYLKAPSMLVFMLLIALRALRFEARYVLAAGVMAIAAWIFLVWYAIAAGDGATVTRSYVQFMNDNRVLLGAEVLRVMAMAIFTLVLALAVRRANTFLTNAILEANVTDELSRFFPDVVARKVRDAERTIHAGEGERREVAILNVDIRGFSDLSADMSPGWTVSLLSEYQSIVVPLVRRHHGLVDKFMGDGIMVTFGTTDESEKHAADALRALDDILARMERDLQPDLAKLEINYAVVAGEVVFGTVGNEERLEYTVIGPSVNMSAKLEKHNKVLGTRALTDKKTWDTALAQGYEPPSGREDPRVVQSQIAGTGAVLDCVVIA